MALRVLALLCALMPLASAFAPAAAGAALSASRSASTITMAHHVMKKATRGHNAYRPRKSRASDRNRTPPSYPDIPDIPWMTPVDSLSGQKLTTVSVAIEPSDTADSVKSKLTAAGAVAPEDIFFGGEPLSGSLGDAGLAESTSLDAFVYSPQ